MKSKIAISKETNSFFGITKGKEYAVISEFTHPRYGLYIIFTNDIGYKQSLSVSRFDIKNDPIDSYHDDCPYCLRVECQCSLADLKSEFEDQ